MDKSALIQKKRRKYLAQLLEDFEANVEQFLPNDVSAAFKGAVRRKMNALAVDATDLLNLPDGVEINGYAIETSDRLYPDGRSRQPQGASHR